MQPQVGRAAIRATEREREREMRLEALYEVRGTARCSSIAHLSGLKLLIYVCGLELGFRAIRPLAPSCYGR
jgi:hypothetical protein